MQSLILKMSSIFLLLFSFSFTRSAFKLKLLKLSHKYSFSQHCFTVWRIATKRMMNFLFGSVLPLKIQQEEVGLNRNRRYSIYQEFLDKGEIVSVIGTVQTLSLRPFRVGKKTKISGIIQVNLRRAENTLGNHLQSHVFQKQNPTTQNILIISRPLLMQVSNILT